MPKKILMTAKQLATENADLRRRLEESEETLNAIRSGEVDALIVSGVGGEQIFTFKQAEEALQKEKDRAQQYLDVAGVMFLVLDADRKVILINKKGCEILGYDEQEIVGRSWSDFLPQAEKIRTGDAFNRAIGGQIKLMEYFENPVLTKSGQERLIAWHNSVITNRTGKIIGVVSSGEDITERKGAEEALRNRESMLQKIFDIIPVGLWFADKDGNLLRGNPAGVKIWGGEPKVGLLDYGLFKGRRLPSGEELAAGDWALAHTVRDGVTIVDELLEIDAFDGEKRTIINFSAPVLDDQGTVQGAIVVNQDITETKKAETRIQRQLEHLTAMSGIDRVISANFDLQLSLSEILAHVTTELAIDAADILILKPAMQMLEYGAGLGFRTTKIRKAQIRLGESFAGRVALERQLIHIQDLSAAPQNSFLLSHLKGEDFVCYFGVPLLVKGQVKGVLEVFHRRPLDPDTEWFDFLNTLAGQAAIAVEIASLFESLQSSNSELFLAYDATIEGWSHALDLRDKETEGHTLRVTDLTVKLAQQYGISEADLIQVRWGALLHDIGKMGVPDGILLKPGPLTDEEWVVMRKHPGLAYELLAPIRYLRLALDIPYCHHEKWDGTGYPRALKGEQIPLAARIFAVVDVWDALTSDRPYRLAWSEEKARQHIRDGAGTHFDPRVVEVFMQFPNKVS
jgi:PAS domain S-box-containing protein/putative nucleotidyltransferase with HDIG domain